MSYEGLLMIGGPRDGQVMPVRDGQPFVRVPVMPAPWASLVDSCREPGETFDVVEYRREWLRDFDGTIVEVLVASGVNNPIQRLIAGYKPTTDSAGEA